MRRLLGGFVRVVDWERGREREDGPPPDHLPRADRVLVDRPDTELAERFGVPLEQIQKRAPTLPAIGPAHAPAPDRWCPRAAGAQTTEQRRRRPPTSGHGSALR